MYKVRQLEISIDIVIGIAVLSYQYMHNVKTSSFLKLFAPYILQKQNYNRDTQAVPLGL